MFRSRYSQMLLSFLCVLGAYFAYSKAIVPLVIPTSQEERQSLYDLQGIMESDEEMRKVLEPLFPETSWERRSQFIIRQNNLVLLFDKYDPSGNVLEVSPCTVLVLPDGEFADSSEQYRQAIIMQASERATLEFDGEFRPTSGTLANFKSGRLHGNVVIRSDMKEPGPDDDLVVETRDVVFNETQVTTEAIVTFRFGKHRGKGEWIIVFLEPSDPKDPKSAKTIQRLEVQKVHQLELEIPSKEGDPAQSERFEIRCAGSFTFNPDKESDTCWVATFNRNVELMRINDGAYDHLTCNTLTVLLGPNPKSDEPGLPNNTVASIGKLAPLKVVGQGQPAKIRSPQNDDFVASGERLEYDFVRDRITLSRLPGSSQVVQISNNGGKNWVTCRTLSYTFGKDGKFGELYAPGAGEFRGESDYEGETKPFHLSWSERFQAIPDPEDPQQVRCDLFGTVKLNMEILGTMTAKETAIWFNQKNSVKRENNGENNGENTGNNITSKLGGGLTGLTPDRARIQKDVLFESPNGTCDLRVLEIWFQEDTDNNEAVSSSFTDPPYGNLFPEKGIPQTNVLSNPSSPSQNKPVNAQDKSTRSFLGNSSDKGNSRFKLSGDVMRMFVKMRGTQADIEQIWLTGSGGVVTLTEIDPKEANKPIQLVGTELHVWSPFSNRTIAKVLGEPKKPAVFSGMETKLTGLVMLLNQQTNRFQVEGAGELVTTQVALANNMEGKSQTAPTSQPASSSQALQVPKISNITQVSQTNKSSQNTSSESKGTLVVRWMKGMDFDGTRIQFDGTVVAMYPALELRCNELLVFLDRPISFMESKIEQDPNAKLIVCNGNVYFESIQMEGAAQKARLRAEGLEQFRLYPATGMFDGTGPGKLRSTFLGSDAAIQMPGMKPIAAVHSETNSGTSSGTTTELKHVDITFYEKIEGNFRTMEASASGLVACVYCPVAQWDETIDPNDRERLKLHNGFRLDCERLHVIKMVDPLSNAEGVEMTATDGTRIEGSQFFARGETVKYNQLKSIASIEGKGTIDAEIHIQRNPGGDYEPPLYGRYLEYNLKTNEVNFQGVHGTQMFNR